MGNTRTNANIDCIYLLIYGFVRLIMLSDSVHSICCLMMWRRINKVPYLKKKYINFVVGVLLYFCFRSSCSFRLLIWRSFFAGLYLKGPVSSVHTYLWAPRPKFIKIGLVFMPYKFCCRNSSTSYFYNVSVWNFRNRYNDFFPLRHPNPPQSGEYGRVLIF